jgi:apolipoprotein N-acyltransferase
LTTSTHTRTFFIRLLLAVSSGVLFALSFPGASLSFLAFVAFVPLIVLLIRVERGRSAFLWGWLSQTIAWLMMAPWVVRVMSYYGGLPVPVGIAVFIAMSLVLGSYGGLFGWAVFRFRLGDGFHRWLLIPLAWAAVEYARTYLLSGYPWNLLASAIVDYTSFAHFAKVAGPYFLGAMVVFTSTVIAWLITQRVAPMARVLVLGFASILVFVWWTSGLVASKLTLRPTGVPPATAALLQPNISQQVRWDPQNTLDLYNRMIAMTLRAIDGGAQVVIWPESTVPLAFTSNEFFHLQIEQIAATKNVDIILGSVAEDPNDRSKIWNSAYLTSPGKPGGRYDKIRLVPFGEFVPMRRFLKFAEKMVHAVGEFQFGTNDHPLRGKFAYGPAICYEVVFPQITRRQVLNGADVLVTITNDAWFDGSSAPRQHLNSARLRAIEDERFLLRAATTGISAFVDPSGEVVQELPMNQEGIIYAKFQPRHGITPYVRFGDWFAWLAVLWSIAASFLGRKRIAAQS